MIGKMIFTAYALFFSFLVYADEFVSKELTAKLAGPTDDQIPELGKLLMLSVRNKNYLIVAGISLAIFVWFFKKFIFPKITTEEKFKPFIPVFSFVMSVLAGLATYILNPGVDPIDLIAAILGSTMIASGSWENMAKPAISLWQNSIKKKTETTNKLVAEANKEASKEEVKNG